MSQDHRIRCDFCGRETSITNAAGRWGELRTTTPTGAVRRDDVCLGCIARLRGWDNPIVAGTGERVLDVIPGPLLPRGAKGETA